MPLYRELRIKWSVFRRLLGQTGERLRYGTPGLTVELRRRRALLLGYSKLLRARGFTQGRYAPEVILPYTCGVNALFQRWKQHTQGNVCARFLVDTQRRRRHIQVVRVAFDGWRTGIGPKQLRANASAALRRLAAGVPSSVLNSTTSVNCPREVQEDIELAGARTTWGARQSFVELRANADLRVARRTVVAGWRGALTREIWLRQGRADRLLKKAARQEPT